MSDKPRGISKELYFFYVENGIPYEGYVEDLGYALREVEIIGVKINKYGDQFLKTHSTPICKMDNTFHSQTQINHQIKNTQDSIDIENKKKEAKEKFKSLIRKFYETLINNHIEEKSRYEISLFHAMNMIEKNILCMADIPGVLQETKECKDYFIYYH